MTAKSIFHHIGIIGFGARGQALATTFFKELPEYGQITAVADIRKNIVPRPEISLYSPDLKSYTDYHDLLADPEIDTVIITTWPESHLEISKAALLAGKSVLCDKPATASLDEARLLYEFVTTHGGHFQLGLNMAYRPACRKASQLLADGALGKVFFVRGFCDVGYDFAHDVIIRKFAGDKAGLVLGKLTHDADFMQFALGTYAEEVCGHTANFQHQRRGDGATSDDTASISGIMHNGILFSLALSSCSSSYSRSFHFFGERGEMFFNVKDDFIEFRYADGKTRREATESTAGAHGGADRAMLIDFFNYVETSPMQPRWPERILSSMMLPLAAMEGKLIQTGNFYRSVVN